MRGGQRARGPALSYPLRLANGRPLTASTVPAKLGEKLLALAAARKTPVLWALGDATNGTSHHMGPHHGPPQPSGDAPSYNQRLLDPASVAAGVNVTLPSTAKATFARVWATAKQARMSGQPSTEVVKGWWEELRAATAQLAPLSATSCTALDECIGVVVGSGTCVCSTAA